MNNAVLRPFFGELPGEAVLAPVIPIKSSPRASVKKVKQVTVKTAPAAAVPAFTDPVFKPKKHDLF